MEVELAAGETKASVNISILHNGVNITEPPEKFFALILLSNKTDVMRGNELAIITILNRNGESSNTMSFYTITAILSPIHYKMHLTKWLYAMYIVVLFLCCINHYTCILCSLSTVIVSFSDTVYTVTEGLDAIVKLKLVRSGYTNRNATVTLCTSSGTAVGIPE